MRHQLMNSFWELLSHNKWHPGTSEMSAPPESVVGTHFISWHGTKTIPVFLPANGEACWLLFPSSVSLLSGSTMQPENRFLYPQGDRSDLKKPKKDKHQH